MLGGTFDPIHVGHLVTGVNVRSELSLDLVLFVVAHDPWQKADRDVTPSADRLAMVAAAVAGHEGLEASAIEIERGGVSYTADTLAALRSGQPDAELFLIVGQDQAANLPTWERVDEIRSLATLVVVHRPGAEGGPVPGPWRQIDVDVPRLEVSSSDLRARFADGRPLDWLVPDAVVRLARERGLYGRAG
ncbi:MAG: nicotinate-nucleotide adenylyltransferase [Actinomycetota bacterium]|nr:nicotinate-nucleotide adenylyltransferase [Actinomycetota bacterium]